MMVDVINPVWRVYIIDRRSRVLIIGAPNVRRWTVGLVQSSASCESKECNVCQTADSAGL